MKNKLPQAPKSPLKFWSIVLGVPVVFVLVVLFMFLYQGSTKDIVSVANQFQPGEGWRLESERVEPPRFVCLDSVNCPSVHKTWIVQKDVSREEFRELLLRSRWNFSVDGDCLTSPNVSGTKGSVCDAKGVLDGYSVIVALSKSTSDQDETNIELYIN